MSHVACRINRYFLRTANKAVNTNPNTMIVGRSLSIINAVVLASFLGRGDAFGLSAYRTRSARSVRSTRLSAKPPYETPACSRRDVFAKSAAAVTFLGSAFAAVPNPAFAASKDAPTKDELARIKKGYEGIQYLLANFEKETTVCRENGGECKRDAEPVRKYMGLRSTTDPLFQIEKVFGKVKNMDDLDLDKLDDFFEATEDWNTAINMSNSMAFISQFAEYNPGGGKDEVLKYLEEAKTQVVLAEKALKKIMDCLELS